MTYRCLITLILCIAPLVCGALTTNHKDRIFDLDSCDTLFVSNYSGSIRIVAGVLDGQVRVRIDTSGRSSPFDFRFFKMENRFYIESKPGMKTKEHSITLWVPSHLKIKVSQVLGNVHVEGVENALDLGVIEGLISMTDVVGKVSAVLSKGKIEFSEVSGPQNIKLSHGLVKLNNTKGKAVVHAVRANVVVLNHKGDVTLKNLNGNSYLKGVRGSIKGVSQGGQLTLKDTRGKHLKLWTDTGRIKVNLISSRHVPNVNVFSRKGYVHFKFPRRVKGRLIGETRLGYIRSNLFRGRKRLAGQYVEKKFNAGGKTRFYLKSDAGYIKISAI